MQVPASAAIGPLPPLPVADVGVAYGLPPGTLVLDASRFGLAIAAAQRYARADGWHGYPFEALDDDAPATPDASLAALGRDLRLDTRSRAVLAQADASPSPNHDVIVAALEAQQDLERLQRRVTDLASSLPGGAAAFTALLDREASGGVLTATERARLDGRLGPGLRADLEDALGKAYLLWPGVADAVANVPAPSPWAGSFAAPLNPILDAAQLAARGRQVNDVVALMSLAYGATPVVLPAVDFVTAVQHLADASHTPLTPAEQVEIADYASALDADVAAALARVIEATAYATATTEQVYATVGLDALLRLDELLSARRTQQAAGAPVDPQLDAQAGELLAAVNDAFGTGGVLALAGALATAAESVQGLDATFGGTDLPVLDTPFAMEQFLLIGTTGDDLTTTTPLLLIDLSGNDRYEQAIGAGTLPGVFLLQVDLEGDDVYQPQGGNGQCGTLGGTNMGVSLFLDVLGNDLYESSGCSYTLGSGYQGLGVFLDASGDDTYIAGNSGFYDPQYFGAGYIGGGFFLDLLGNDAYSVSITEGYTFAGSLQTGLGVFLEGAGDDTYDNARSQAFASSGLGGVTAFLELEGDDAYKTRAAGFGYGFVAPNVFLDAGGVDTYDVGSYQPSCLTGACYVGDDQMWQSPAQDPVGLGLGGLPTLSMGADRAVPIPGVLSNVQARIAVPRSGSVVATDETVDVLVSAINTGSASVSSVTGNLLFVSAGGATSGEVLAQQQVSFGTVPANGRVDKTVQWTTPASEVAVQLRLVLVGIGDADPSDNAAFSNVRIDDVQRISLTDLYVTSSGFVTPGAQLSPSVWLENRGNVEGMLDVTFQFLDEDDHVVGTTQQSVTIARNSPYADVGGIPVRKQVNFTIQAPGTNGNYTARVLIPSDAHDPYDPSKTEVSRSVRVFLIQDLAVQPVRDTYLADPGFFTQDGGFQWTVRNTGTVPMQGGFVVLSSATPGTPTVTQNLTVPQLAPDAFTTFTAPSLAIEPAAGKTWTFTATLTATGDSKPQNNQLTRTVRFENDVVTALDFENDRAGDGPTSGSQWGRGTPSWTSTPNSNAGPSVWSNGMSGYLPYSNPSPKNHDLVLTGIDLANYLDPRISVAHTLNDLYGNPGSNYGMVASLSVRRAGSATWERVTPDGGYPCEQNFNQADTGPGFCGNLPWSTAKFNLGQFSGTVVDLRFRTSMASYYPYSNMRGWTIDDLRLFGVRRIDQDVGILKVDIPDPALKGTQMPITVHVRNNGFSDVLGLDVDVKLRKGTTGPLQVLQTTGPATLAPLQVGQYTVQWTPTSASFYSSDVRLTSTGSDPRPLNNVVADPIAVYDDLANFDPQDITNAGWSVETSGPNDWQLGTPTNANRPKTAFTGNRIWDTNLAGSYTAPDQANGIYAYYQTLVAPKISIAGNLNGDEYGIIFQHQYDMTSYSGYYYDLGYVTAKVIPNGASTGAIKLLSPEGGYPGKSQYAFSPVPPENPGLVGYTSDIEAYQPAMLPLGQLSNGDQVQPRFNHYANYCYSCQRGSGWALDDIHVVRLPRFDQDVKADFLGPSILDIGTTDALSVQITNLGRQATQAFPLLTTIETSEGPVLITTPVPVLQPGDVRLVPVEVDVPLDVGVRDVHIEAAWPNDEWADNNQDDGQVRLARVLYRNDFEQGPGGFAAGAGSNFKLGTRTDADPIQGIKSWFTGPFPTGCCGSAAEILDFPAFDVDTGIRYPQMLLTGKAGFAVSTCNGQYSLSNYRLFDSRTNSVLAMSPLPLIDLYSGYSFGTPGHCSVNAPGNPLDFTTDLTARQDVNPQLQLSYQGKLYCCPSGTNTGMELDDIALFAVPYLRNVGVTGFSSPPGGLLGPGEEVPIQVGLVGGGISWPLDPVGLRIFSNDALGPGGRPSLDTVIPVPVLALGESLNLSTTWRPAEALDGQSLLLSAQLVSLSGNGRTPLLDESLLDNLVAIPVSVLSVHHVRLGLVADPNVDPDAVRPVNVAAVVQNLGTRTESNVRVVLTYSTLDGAVLEQRVLPAVQKRPDVAQAPLRLSQTWTPPGPGHYRIEGRLSYANDLLDFDPLGRVASTQVHAASLPDRLGSAFDTAGSSTGWEALGGRTALAGFALANDGARPAGHRGVLASGPYEADARYEYAFLAEVPSGASAQLAWAQKLGLDAGDAALVQASRDGGATWATLDTFTGSAGWAERTLDLSGYTGLVHVRFLLEADGSGPSSGSGWSLDDAAVLVAGSPVRLVDFEDPLGEVLQSWDFEASGDEGWTHDGDAPAGGASVIDDFARGTPSASSGVAPQGGSKVWKTNLNGDYTLPCTYSYPNTCAATDNTYGARRLTSPTINVPAGRDHVSLSWWQWREVYEGGMNCYGVGSCYGARPDLASVRIVAGANQYAATPATGYNSAGTETLALGGLGFSGRSDGWERQSIDLSAYAGQAIQVVFQLATPSSANDYYRGGQFPPPVGDMGGLAIDDVRLLGTPTAAGLNTAVLSAATTGSALGGTPTPVTVRLGRTGGSAPVTVSYEWVGPDGLVLPAPSPSTVNVGPAGASVPITLPAVDPQRTVLRIRADSGSAGDDDATDDVFELPLVVERTIYTTKFGASGDSACAKTSPCQGWTHTLVVGGQDEWDHGSIPAAKFPGAAKSSPYAFATDIAGGTYEANYAQARLSSPTINVPASGATLRFQHAMQTVPPYAGLYFDGGRLSVNGLTLPTQGDYSVDDCGYYANSQPCWTGEFGWRGESADLARYAGQAIKLDFLWSTSYQATPGPTPKAGWSIDDVLVSAAPALPSLDLQLSVPDIVRVDATSSTPITLGVRNLGTAASQPSRVVATLYRDGAVLSTVPVNLPGLAGGAAWTVEVPLPSGSLDGVLIDAVLRKADGQAWTDGDPANDHARAAVEPVYPVLSLAAADGAALIQGEAKEPGFTVGLPPNEAGAPARAFLAGFDKKLGGAQSLVIPAVAIPPGAELSFQHRVLLSGRHDGAFVEASVDGGKTWKSLSPLGGYTHQVKFAYDSPCNEDYLLVGGCYSGDRGWSQAIVPLDSLAGKTAWLRFRYDRGDATPNGAGWAIEAVRITAPGQAQNLLDAPRWSVGPVTNRNGPLEEASQPNAWGTGLAGDLGRARSFDVLQSPAVPSRDMLLPTVGFDWYGVPEKGGSLLTQVRDATGGWRTVGYLTGQSPLWRHAEIPLGEVGDHTQVRFVYTVPDGKTPGAAPGYFVDNVVVGSLRGQVDVHVPTEGGKELPVQVDEASNTTVMARFSNPGAFTNRYVIDVRGLDPTWGGGSTTPFTLGPGQSIELPVRVNVPFLREEGLYPVIVLARSVFDPLVAAVDEILFNVTVAPKPDYVVKSVTFQSSFLLEGDSVRHVEDARPNTIVAEIENVGRAPGQQDLEVLFLEHYADGEVRPIDVALVPRLNLTHPDDPGHASYGAFVDWFPRKGIIGIEVVANPEAQDNRFPANPESTFSNNAYAAPVIVEPRPLPELQYAAPPAFSRLPQLGLPVALGVDVRNGGNAPSLTPVDVALMAASEDGLLTSPTLNVPSNSILYVQYSSDLELRADGYVLEAKVDGAWERLVPNGGYPNGCLLGFGCGSGVSGRADHRTLAFNLAGLEGPTQLRVRFAMDSHNGRTFDGLQLHAITIEQFGQRAYRADFTSSSAGWTAGPDYVAKDGSLEQVFRYRSREGPIPGAWTIPTNYANPYLVALKSVKPVATGSLEHVDLDWTPRQGGDLALRLFIDPKNAEPEYIDDLNQRDFTQRVAVSGFELRPSLASACGGAAICLADAQAGGDLPVQLVNTGNTRTRFELRAQAHPFLDATLLVGDRALTSLEMDPGASVDGILRLKAHAAPAAVHTVQFDILDTVAGKTTKVGVAIKVNAATGTPLQVSGLVPFTVVADDRHAVSIQNPSNQVVPVLLRAGDKPSGLAMRVTPNEFTLAPFESRTVDIELLNLGVSPASYQVPLVNARTACAEGASDCGVIARITAQVAEYAPPVAKFVVDGPMRPNLPVTFTDTSTSKGSSVTGWAWDFGDGSTGAGASPVHVYNKPGVYQVVLKVTDGEGQSTTSPPKTVVMSNDAPVAKAEADLVNARTGQAVNFTAMRSLDADGGIAKVTWAFGDGALLTGLNVTHTYRTAGTYHVVVAVEDAYGAVDIYDLDVTIAGDAVIDVDDNKAEKESPLAPWLALLAIALVGFVRRRRA